MITIKELEKSNARKLLISDFIKKYEHLLPDPYSLHVNIDEYSSKLNEFGVAFVAQNDEEIIGLISGYINDYVTCNAYLQIIIVRQISQNSGCGSALIRAFIGKAVSEYKCGNVFLNVDKSNTHAYEVYKHLGFIESKRVHPNPLKQIMQYTF